MSVRALQSAFLDEGTESLRFVNASRALALAKLGIKSVRDLLEHYPKRYIDMSQVTSVESARIGDEVTIVGKVGEVKVKRPRPRLTIVEVSLLDGTECLFGTWFSQPWMADRFHAGDTVAFSGKIEFNYGFKRMNSPFAEVLESNDANDDERPLGRVVAIHPLTAGISAGWMRRFMLTALEEADTILDPLPAPLRERYRLIPLRAAYEMIHFPADMDEVKEARRRLAYGEILTLQLQLMMRRASELSGTDPVLHEVAGSKTSGLKAALPFTLTPEQEAAVADIAADMAAPRSMNRMLLGDVGTGKTAVAAFGLAAVADTGTQAAMMAPTSVLAQQYARKLGPLLDEVGISWSLLTGATPAAERTQILEGLASGSLTVVFGTHALIEPDVVFARLSLVIIDEQHRFGVDQRAALRAKGPGSDLLVMTATPIPRTLALTLYGDLSCSYIRTRPIDTAPTTTTILPKRRRPDAYEAIREAVEEGRQAYLICPLVGIKLPKDDDEAMARLLDDLENDDDVSEQKAAVDEARFLQTKVFPHYTVGLLTGRMKAAEKNEVMERFRSGEIDILVSTTVVEVGVDVANATVMVIEDAERFGLSQLHQLRGRVGRGSHPGQVFLVADARSDEAKERLGALAATNDGFELAEYDLKLRREGDILGRRQHGLASCKLVDVIHDGPLIQAAHDDAIALLEEDPGLTSDINGPLRLCVKRLAARIEDDLGGA